MIGGHQVLIAAPPHCGYGPCVSISPGTPHRRARPDDGDRQLVTSSVTPAAAAPAASKPASPPALCMAPAVPLRPAPPQAQQVAPPPPVQRPQIQSVQAIPLPPPITTAAITPPPPPIPQSPAPIPPASPPQEIVPPLEVAPQVFNDAPESQKSRTRSKKSRPIPRSAIGTPKVKRDWSGSSLAADHCAVTSSMPRQTPKARPSWST